MGWRFRKSIKIIPGVRINLSTKGISTTIGVRGASINVSSRGTYLNTGIPGTGISYRQKIGDGVEKNSLHPSIPPELMGPYFAQPLDNILTLDVMQVTSQDMQGIKEAIVVAEKQRSELPRDIMKVRATWLFSNMKLAGSYLLLFGLYNKSIPATLKSDIAVQKDTLQALNEQLKSSSVRLEVEFDDEIKHKFQRMADSYKNLILSVKIWDITGSYYQDRVATRSAASTVLKRTQVKFNTKVLSHIECDFPPFHFYNANGADIFFYPNFILMFQNRKEFAIIGYHELKLRFDYSRFLEEQGVPSDSQVVDHTWAKVNKNGSRDKRFKDNHQIPIALYGEIILETTTGMNEAYMFSNYEACNEFCQTFIEYQRVVSKLKAI